MAGVGRPIKRIEDKGQVGLFFKVDGRLKNLLVDMSDGFGVSLTEMLTLMVLREAGLGSLDEYVGVERGGV